MIYKHDCSINDHDRTPMIEATNQQPQLSDSEEASYIIIASVKNSYIPNLEAVIQLTISSISLVWQTMEISSY